MTGAVAQRFVPPPAPKTPKAAGTRQRLLEVAGRLFIERGYEAVSMRDLAAAARVTKGAVYGHFRSKGQLLVEVIRSMLAAREHAPDFPAATADAQHGVELMYDPRGREVRLLEVDAAAAARHDPEVAAGLAELYEERHARIRDAVADAPDPDAVVWLISAISAGIGSREAAGAAALEPARMQAVLMAVVDGVMREVL